MILLVLLSLYLVVSNVVSNHILWWLHLLDLKVDHCAAYLDGLRNGHRQRQPLSDQNQCAKFRHVVLKVEAIVFESNDGMATADTDIIDSEVAVMASS